MYTRDNAAERPLDPIIRKIDRLLDRAVLALVVVLAPIALARLPHYLEAGFFVMGCAAIALLFNLTVRLGQKLGYVGPTALDALPKTSLFEDTSLPAFKGSPPITDRVADNPTLERACADTRTTRHTITLPGRGRIVYWSDERRD